LSRLARLFPRASGPSPLRGRMCHRRNSAATSRRSRHRSSWNGSTPR
jgi:hypothetical protein